MFGIFFYYIHVPLVKKMEKNYGLGQPFLGAQPPEKGGRDAKQSQLLEKLVQPTLAVKAWMGWFNWARGT